MIDIPEFEDRCVECAEPLNDAQECESCSTQREVASPASGSEREEGREHTPDDGEEQQEDHSWLSRDGYITPRPMHHPSDHLENAVLMDEAVAARARYPQYLIDPAWVQSAAAWLTLLFNNPNPRSALKYDDEEQYGTDSVKMYRLLDEQVSMWRLHVTKWLWDLEDAFARGPLQAALLKAETKFRAWMTKQLKPLIKSEKCKQVEQRGAATFEPLPDKLYYTTFTPNKATVEHNEWLKDGARGAARVVAARCKGWMVPDPAKNNVWYVWNEAVMLHVEQDNAFIASISSDVLSPFAKTIDEHPRLVKLLECPAARSRIVAEIRTGFVGDKRQRVECEDFVHSLDCTRHLLPIKDNQVINLRDGTVRPRTSDDKFTFSLNIGLGKKDKTMAEQYIQKLCAEPSDRAAARLHHLRENLKEDIGKANDAIVDAWLKSGEEKMWVRKPTKERRLKDWLGYLCTGEVLRRQMLVIIGGIRTGKSKILERGLEVLLSSMYVGTADPRVLMGEPRGDAHGHTAGLAPLKGRRVVYLSENNKSSVLNTATVAALVGNGTLVARDVHEKQDRRPKPNQAKLVLLCNNLPKYDLAKKEELFPKMDVIELCRQWAETPENTKFVDETMLGAEFQESLLNVALDGAVRLYQHIWIKVNSEEVWTQYSGCSADAFFRSCVVKTQSDDNNECFITSDNMYTAYEYFCQVEGSDALSSGQFGLKMTSLTNSKSKAKRIISKKTCNEKNAQLVGPQGDLSGQENTKEVARVRTGLTWNLEYFRHGVRLPAFMQVLVQADVAEEKADAEKAAAKAKRERAGLLTEAPHGHDEDESAKRQRVA